MALTLAEYADALEARNLIWPKVPAPQAVKATPSIAPIPGIRAVLWDVYGTILRVPDGHWTMLPADEIRLQIALDKTIHEFNMWNHMYRKPGPPWQSMIGIYKSTIERLAMRASARGDITDVSLVDVWRALIEKLFEKDYSFDEGLYGDLDEFSEKVAYFFHCSLQATEARVNAVRAISDLSGNGIVQGFLADGQSFTLVQLLRSLSIQGDLPPLHEVFRPQTLLFSSMLGVKKPSASLFAEAVSRLRTLGLQSEEILHVSCRLTTDLAPAKAVGMKTALLAAEKVGLEVSPETLKNPATRPDRLLTDLTQISSVVRLS